MQSEKVRAFKNLIKNYQYYQLRIDTLKKDIEYCFYQLGGVKGNDPSKEPIHSAPNKEYEWRVREDISNYEAKLAVYTERIEEIEKVVALLPNDVQEVVKDVYFKGLTYDVVANKHYISKSTINDKINRELEKVLD